MCAEASLPLVGAVSIGSVASMRSQTSIASELYHEQVALDVHPLRMLCTSEFHCLLACTFVAMGTGLGIVNNLPQLIQSLSPGGVALPDLKDNLLILFFVCNMSGRILAGYVPERCLHLYVRPSPLCVLCRIDCIDAEQGANGPAERLRRLGTPYLARISVLASYH